MGNVIMALSRSIYQVKLLFLILWVQSAALQPDFLPCCRQSTDHNATNMLQVYKDPTSYLCGPFTLEENQICTEEQKKMLHFVIVGGGIAGLTSARLLLSVGHKVTLLES